MNKRVDTPRCCHRSHMLTGSVQGNCSREAGDVQVSLQRGHDSNGWPTSMWPSQSVQHSRARSWVAMDRVAMVGVRDRE
jgi:hypothetical protein